MEGDWEIVRGVLADAVNNGIPDGGTAPGTGALSVLARIEAEHKRLKLREQDVAEARMALGAYPDDSLEGVAKRLRADSERLAFVKNADVHEIAKAAWERRRAEGAEPMAKWSDGPQTFRDHRVAMVRCVLKELLGDEP